MANPKSASFDGGGFTQAAAAGANGGVKVAVTAAIDGTYYVAVTTGGSGVSYTLAVTLTNDAGSLPIPANNIPGTPIQIGSPVASIIDQNTKPRDVFAVDLQRGQVISFVVTTAGNASVTVANPKSTSFDGGGFTQATAASANGGVTAKLTVPADGTYYVAVSTGSSGVSYTLNVVNTTP